MENTKLAIVQILRFAAAFWVVFFHVPLYLPLIWLEHPENSLMLYLRLCLSRWGVGGVDLFFVISGFIMVWVSFGKFRIPGSSLAFIKRRLIRIVPIYWTYTSLTLIIASIILVFAPQLWRFTYSVNLPNIIGSYLFIPTGYPPIVGLGWTLNYEMYFYILFAVILCFRINIAIIGITSFFIICPIVGGLYSFTFPILVQNTDWILLDFIFGIWIGYFFSQGRWLSKFVSVAFVIVGGSFLFIIPIIYGPAMLKFGFGTGMERLLLLGIPTALSFAAIISLFRHLPNNWLIKSLEKAGDASYSIYLFSFFSLPGVIYIFTFIGFTRFIPYEILVLPIGICSIFSSYIAYLLVEKPLTTYFRKKFIPKTN